jgi:hypothetical protein
MTEDDLIEAGRVICDAYERYAPVPAVLRSEAPNIARALAEAGLLADPAQTTELEELRAQAATAFADTAKLRSMYAEGGAMHLEIDPPHELVFAWVRAARAMLDDAPNYCETRVDAPKVEMVIKAAGELDRYAVTIQRVGNITPHEARQKAEAERDLALWLHAEALWWLDQYKRDVTVWRTQAIVAEQREQAAESRETLCQDERDKRQARIDAALALIPAEVEEADSARPAAPPADEPTTTRHSGHPTRHDTTQDKPEPRTDPAR